MQRGPATLRGSRGQQSSCARPAPLHHELPCVPTMHAFLLVAERAVVCSSTHTMTRCLPGAGIVDPDPKHGAQGPDRDPVRSSRRKCAPACRQQKLCVLTAYAFINVRGVGTGVDRWCLGLDFRAGKRACTIG